VVHLEQAEHLGRVAQAVLRVHLEQVEPMVLVEQTVHQERLVLVG
jgi:hypothetical protein